MRGSMFQSPVASPCLVDISKQTARRIDLYARFNFSISFHFSLSRSLIDISKQTARRIDLYARSNVSINLSLSRSLVDILKTDRG
jgi:hypothetical protein